MAQVRVVSIDKMRADAVLVTRGLLALALLPTCGLLLLVLRVVPDLPDVNLTPLRLLLALFLVALTVAALFAGRYGSVRLTAPYLWFLIIASLSLIGIGCVAVGWIAVKLWGRKEALESAEALLGIAVLLISIILLLVIVYWILLSPTKAALRLLATRVPPDGTPLPTVLASHLTQSNTDGASAPYKKRHPAYKKRRPAAVAYSVAAAALGIVAVALVIWVAANGLESWLFANGQAQGMAQMVLAVALEFAAIYVVTVLWRRGRKHAAVDSHATQQRDPRRRILYLRSFQDDSRMMDAEWDMVVRTEYGRAGHSQGPIARLIASLPTGILNTGGRLEENLAGIVAPIGPFVAIGAPDEPLPQLGAARAYFPEDTWQGQVIEWVDSAQLIVQVAGPTRWIRWELDTILDRGAWPKLVILMPPAQEDHAGRWANIVDALRDGPWRDALAVLDPHEVLAMRMLEGGALSVVTSDWRRPVDYSLAMRIMLHQIQSAVPN